MLVLNRRIGETVMIADDISVTVLAVKGTQVRLGLAAPQTVPIHREEIYDRIRRERMSSISRPPDSNRIRELETAVKISRRMTARREQVHSVTK